MKRYMSQILNSALVLSVTILLAVPCQGATDYESIELFTDVLAIIKKSYVTEVSTAQLMSPAISGIEKVCAGD
jgi:carboxyl-terminal processing protease